MKIHQLLGAPSIILTNEENQFVDTHENEIPIRSLYDREEVVARNLVRKGVYEISNDNSLILNKNANNRKTSI
jgi:hypothetical protein